MSIGKTDRISEVTVIVREARRELNNVAIKDKSKQELTRLTTHFDINGTRLGKLGGKVLHKNEVSDQFWGIVLI
jgi:hypothetical protein